MKNSSVVVNISSDMGNFKNRLYCHTGHEIQTYKQYCKECGQQNGVFLYEKDYMFIPLHRINYFSAVKEKGEE